MAPGGQVSRRCWHQSLKGDSSNQQVGGLELRGGEFGIKLMLGVHTAKVWRLRSWITKSGILKCPFLRCCFLCWVTFGLLGSAGVMIISHKLHKNFKAAIRRTVSSQFSAPSKAVPIASAEEAALSPLGHRTPPPALDTYLLWFTQRRQDFHQLSLPLYPKS